MTPEEYDRARFNGAFAHGLVYLAREFDLEGLALRVAAGRPDKGTRSHGAPLAGGNSGGVRCILLKAAEDVQSGMWCKGDYYAVEIDENRHVTDAPFWGPTHLFTNRAFETVADKYRRAEGSLALVTWQLGGNHRDYRRASQAVRKTLHERFGEDDYGYPMMLHEFNDDHLPDDPFEAGQQLAELFRSTAESL